MDCGWLVNGPVVVWWVSNWVLGIKLNKGYFIWADSHVNETEASSSLSVWVEHRLWMDKNWLISLGKGNSDWCWLIGHKVLEVSSGNIGIHELEEAI